MPMWRCPHCGTPQAETARCWVCRRSSTACATCRHFRRSVAAQIGYCALDRRREPLVGDEIRACWEAAPVAADPVVTSMEPVSAPGGPAVAAAVPEPVTRNARDFVEVGTTTSAAPRPKRVTSPEPSPSDAPVAASAALPQAEPGWSLWSDLEG